MKKIVFLTLSFFVFLSCRKDDKIEPISPATVDIGTSVKLNFEAAVNSTSLILNSGQRFTNFFGDSFTVRKFNYYLSNFKLKTIEGYVFSEPESYHLIRNDIIETTSFTIQNMPEGTYKSIEFLIGVDSLHNVSGAQTGDLDPIKLMFWDWNTGYIFLKLEGEYSTINSGGWLQYSYHVGGYAGPYNCVRKCSITFPNNLEVVKGSKPEIYLKAVIDELFKSPEIIDMDTYNAITTGKKAYTLSDNYSDIFIVTKVTN